MKAEVDYNFKLTPTETIEIKNIGDCGIECFSEENGFNYYILTTTDLGVTTIYAWGPLIPDINILPKGFTFEKHEFQYKESNIVKFLNKYINNVYLKISDAKEITKEEVIENAINIKDYLKGMVNIGYDEEGSD